VRKKYFARRKAVLVEMAAVREAELRLRHAIQKGKEDGRAEVPSKDGEKWRPRGRLSYFVPPKLAEGRISRWSWSQQS
jgi:hypothetical protein